MDPDPIFLDPRKRNTDPDKVARKKLYLKPGKKLFSIIKISNFYNLIGYIRIRILKKTDPQHPLSRM